MPRSPETGRVTGSLDAALRGPRPSIARLGAPARAPPPRHGPRPLRLCHDPSRQSRAGAGLPRGDGAGSAHLSRLLAAPAGRGRPPPLPPRPRGAWPLQALGAPQPSARAAGGGAARARPHDPELARRPHPRHPLARPLLRGRGQLFLLSRPGLAGRRPATGRHARHRLAARLRRRPLLAATQALLSHASAMAGRRRRAAADARSHGLSRRRPRGGAAARRRSERVGRPCPSPELDVRRGREGGLGVSADPSHRHGLPGPRPPDFWSCGSAASS